MSDNEQKDVKHEKLEKLTFTRQKKIDNSPIVPVNKSLVDIELGTRQKAIQVNPIVPVNQPVIKVKTESEAVVDVKTETKQK